MRSSMNFKGYEENNNNNNKPPPPNPNPNPTQLFSQSSIYSLTFDEFQNTMGGLGKDFGSMNMDELLKNIWTAEETQSINMSSPSLANNGAEASTNNNNNSNNYYPYYDNLNGNLQRQGSLTLPRTLSQKTVDEVWKDLMMKEISGGVNNGTKDNNGGVNNVASAMPQRQQTLGEMTLEEFLVRAGVVREDNNTSNINISSCHINNSNNNVPPLQIGRPGHGQWFNNENTSLMLGFQQQQPNNNMGNNTNPMVNTNSPVSIQQPTTLSLSASASNHTQQQHSQQQLPLFPKPANVAFASAAAAPMNMMGGLAAVSPTNQISPAQVGAGSSPAVPYVINRPRKCSAIEKVVERRQRRMIKNRESAARSRARKQAYTLELEAEVGKLKALNQELKRKQAKIMEMQKNNNQALVTLNGAWGGKRLCLRRTLTGPW